MTRGLWRNNIHAWKSLLFRSHLLALFFVFFPPFLLHAMQDIENGLMQKVSTDDEIQGGVFLVADRKIMDPNFSKTVVLILHHDAGGSSGLVINRPTRQTLPELLPNVEWVVPSEPIFDGGPVLREETLTLLFRTKTPPQALSPVFEDVYVTQKARIFAELLQDDTQSEVYRLYAGYAGWAPGQLQAEMTRGDWRVLAGDADVLFEKSTEQIWMKMFARSQRRFVKRDKVTIQIKERERS